MQLLFLTFAAFNREIVINDKCFPAREKCRNAGNQNASRFVDDEQINTGNSCFCRKAK